VENLSFRTVDRGLFNDRPRSLSSKYRRNSLTRRWTKDKPERTCEADTEEYVKATTNGSVIPVTSRLPAADLVHFEDVAGVKGQLAVDAKYFDGAVDGVDVHQPHSARGSAYGSDQVFV
jgi:hypothetical protein